MNTNSRRELAETGKLPGADALLAPMRRYEDEVAESALLERCKEGDMSAWDTLVRMYEKPVYRLAYSLCRNAEDAADISGHVFVRIYQNLRTFRHEATFSSWLFRIVRNTHLDMCVRPAWRSDVSLEADRESEEKSARPLTHDVVDPGESPETQCLKKEVGRLLAHAVKYLPAYQREVIRLFHSDGKTYEEIAAMTGISIGTVKSRLNRARTMLRERLTPDMDTLMSV